MIDLRISRRDFRSTYFERMPAHFGGALTDRPLAWADVDQLLATIEPRAGKVRMFDRGLLPEHAYAEEFIERGRAKRRFDKAKFYELMSRGATLQLNWLEEQSVVAKRLCLEIARFAGAQTSGNAYVSFAGDGSFGRHWDTHDVFVIQLIGRKRWRIFSPTFPLPLTHQTHDRSGHACPEAATLELTLEEGDVLYVPRGWWHHVIPLDVGSFHLSVGTYAPSLFDYAVQTSAKYLEQQLAMRQSFSAAGYRDAVEAVIRGLHGVLLDEASAAAFERDWIVREPMSAEFNLASLDRSAVSIRGDAEVGLATFHEPTLENGMIAVNGRMLRLDPGCLAVVAALRDAGPLRFDALCARLEGSSREAVQRAVLELARHDVATIEQRA